MSVFCHFACMSALVSVKFNSHVFPVQWLIKDSHILIDRLEVQHGPSTSVQCEGKSAAAIWKEKP